MRFFNPFADIQKHDGFHLPHWQQPGATYFVTFRLADSIPAERLAQWSHERTTWLKWNPQPWTPEQERDYFERFAVTIERWLDAGEGSCALRHPVAAESMAGALMFFHEKRCFQHAWVVMPNHVHALFTLAENQTLDALLHSWKSYTSHELTKALRSEWPGWQRDYFDRIIRDEEHFFRVVRYIHDNPIKAKLPASSYRAWESGSHGVPP